MPGTACSLAAHAVDHARAGEAVALGQRLQADEHPPAVDRAAPCRAADRGADARDRRIGQHDLGHLLLQLEHRLERDVRRRIGEADDQAGIVLREIAVRRLDIELDRDGDGGEEHEQGEARGGAARRRACARSRAIVRDSMASTMRSSQVAFGLGASLTKCAQIIGVTVSDTKVEITIAKVSVSENSRNTRPTTPSMNSSGMNAAISDRLIEITVKPICRAPSSAARIGEWPFSRLRNMFSIMTMASSTTKPTEIASAISDRLSIE